MNDSFLPPRRVHLGTQVQGHEVKFYGAAGRNFQPKRASCSCGRLTSSQTVEEHIAAAWPIVVPRLPGEPLPDLYGRVEQAATHYGALVHGRDAHIQPISPGGKFPPLGDDVDPEDVLEAVQHQLADLRPFV